METEFRQNLLECANKWCELTGRKLTTAGIHAAGFDRFFTRLQADKPKGFNVRTYDKAMKWFAENWPEGKEKPECLNGVQSDIDQSKKSEGQPCP